MAFDFSKVMKSLEGVSTESTEKSYKYKLVYPNEGSLNVRLLFNPKSGLITRLINRHNIGGTKIPCMATYTSKSDCPICKVMEQAENAGVKVPYTSKSKVRAIMYAQFHSASYEIEGVNRGDIILLMVPWSAYKLIQKFILDVSSTPESMNKAFNSPEYYTITIEKGKSNTEWNARLNPVLTLKSASSQDEFEKMIEEVDSLYDAVSNIHETPTDNDIKMMNEAADQLRSTLYSESEPTTPEAPVNPNQEPTTASAALNTAPNTLSDLHPECFGKLYTPEDVTETNRLVQKVKCRICEYKNDCNFICSNS